MPEQSVNKILRYQVQDIQKLIDDLDQQRRELFIWKMHAINLALKDFQSIVHYSGVTADYLLEDIYKNHQEELDFLYSNGEDGFLDIKTCSSVDFVLFINKLKRLFSDLLKAATCFSRDVSKRLLEIENVLEAVEKSKGKNFYEVYFIIERLTKPFFAPADKDEMRGVVQTIYEKEEHVETLVFWRNLFLSLCDSEEDDKSKKSITLENLTKSITGYRNIITDIYRVLEK